MTPRRHPVQAVPHSYRNRPERLPLNPSTRRPWPPPGWTGLGLTAHEIQHAENVRALRLLFPSDRQQRRLRARGEPTTPEPSPAEVAARVREVAQYGRSLAEGAQALQEATTALLALPWVAQATTREIPQQRQEAAS